MLPLTLSHLLRTDHADSVLARGSEPYRYSPYGYDCTGAGRSGFTGAYQEQSGPAYLLGNGYRAFTPTRMRFDTADRLSPFGEGGRNAYAYCGADPVNRTDHSGQAPIAIVELLTEIWKVTKQSLIPGTKPLGVWQGSRRLALQQTVQKLPRQTVFNKAVMMVNSNQMSHGTRELSISKFKQYKKLTAMTANGEAGSTYAFITSSHGWLRDATSLPAERVTGMVFNGSGAFVAAAIEHSSYKTGAYLR